MAFGTERQILSGTAAGRAAVDEGLRQHMLRVYNYMASGLALTGVVAYITANTPALLNVIFGTPLAYVFMFLPLVGFLFIPGIIARSSARAGQIAFWGFAGALGLSYSYILLAYTGDSVVRVFFVTAGMFAAMSLYGYTTKKDLTGWVSFLVMGTWGILIAIVVNMFIDSSALDFAISGIGVIIGVGLTAYDTQKIKEMYLESDSMEVAEKKAVLGALELYFDFLYIFIMLLRLFGVRR